MPVTLCEEASPRICYIGLGSNLDNPSAQLEQALVSLGEMPESRLLRVSSYYQSAAIGPGEQADYLNAVASLETGLSAVELLLELQSIEKRQGRTRNIRWGARTLDLDLLLFGQHEIRTDRLTVPHVMISQRSFVLQPLQEIAPPTLMIPGQGRLDTLLEQCPYNRIRKLTP